MGIVYQIPPKSRFISSALTFEANFDPITGQYNFDVPANKEVLIEVMNQNTIYIIDRLILGADIEKDIYTDSIFTLPELNIRRSINKLQVYQRPLSIPQLSDSRDIIAWVWSDKKGDKLVADFSGILNQVASTVGNAQIRIYASLEMYAVDATLFGNRFRDILSDDTGQQVRGKL